MIALYLSFLYRQKQVGLISATSYGVAPQAGLVCVP